MIGVLSFQIRRASLLLFLLAVICSVSSCSYRRDITSDPKFDALVGHKIQTKKTLRLYGHFLQTDSPSYDLTTVNEGSEYLIGFVPPKTPVKILRIYEYHDIGIMWRGLTGELYFNGKRYAFSFHLGTHAYPDSWRRIFDSFETAEE